MAGVASSNRQRSKLAPYLMILPALAYLGGVFYVVPFVSLLRTSLSTMGGSIYLPELTFAWDFGNYGEALSEYREQILRSFGYALTATVLCLLLAFPLAYVIAFKAGAVQEPSAGPGDPAVLRDVPDPNPGVENDPRRRRLGGPHIGFGRAAAVGGGVCSPPAGLSSAG